MRAPEVEESDDDNCDVPDLIDSDGEEDPSTGEGPDDDYDEETPIWLILMMKMTPPPMTIPKMMTMLPLPRMIPPHDYVPLPSDGETQANDPNDVNASCDASSKLRWHACIHTSVGQRQFEALVDSGCSDSSPESPSPLRRYAVGRRLDSSSSPNKNRPGKSFLSLSLQQKPPTE